MVAKIRSGPAVTVVKHLIVVERLVASADTLVIVVIIGLEARIIVQLLSHPLVSSGRSRHFL